MTSTATYTDYTPVSIAAAAPGWRAAYIQPPDDVPGWSADPVVCWAVVDVAERPCRDSIAPEQDRGREIVGVVFDDYLHNPEDVSNFWRYLPPGVDPTPAEVAAEQAHRAELAAIAARRKAAR